MKTQILFIHSAGSQENGGGSSGLSRFLTQSIGDEYEIVLPKMPNPEYPEYASWKARLKKELAFSRDPVVLVGHSLGGSVILKYLTEEICKRPVSGLFLVATPFWGEKDWDVEEFVLTKDFSRKLPPIPHIFLYHSRNDNVVPYSHLKIYEEKLNGVKVREYGGNDHAFESGLTELITDIKNL